MIEFIVKYNNKKNLYYSVNSTRTAMTKKAKKTDIAKIEYLFADLDPADDESPEGAKARYLASLVAFEPKACAVIDSGNGIQAIWKLKESIDLSQCKPIPGKEGLELAPEAKAIADDVEARTAALMRALGGCASTQNIDRILRLPGTTNLPNKTKLAAGRIPCPAKLLSCYPTTTSFDAFLAPAETDEDEDDGDEAGGIDWAEVEKHAGWLKSAADLPDDFNRKGRMIVAHSGTIHDLGVDLMAAGLIEKKYASNWSAVSFALAAIFKIDGRYSNEKIAAALMCPLECNRHVTKLKPAQQRRAVSRLIFRSYEPKAHQVAHAAPWRECTAKGMPIPSMHNARLAIAALGVECSFDTFHNKMLVGYQGDKTKHEIEAIMGEVTDNAIIRLRQIMSDKFGFDLGDKFTRDAIVSLALEHCFDPVRDMLDKAEAHWDGIERLDEAAMTYFNVEDTSLNRAIIRKTLIGAVARARHPGCKFDTITVLESIEGWNKSTAWRVIAGDENFSDASILGHSAREVQEQLAEIWIHENADLAGMRKAEVETIKSFASRQSDDARPAYGHFLKKQKRHSIEVGTTNSDEYLQSQTGNRRFWPLRVHKTIDIDQLKRDRLLLLGEAAAYEAKGEALTLDPELWRAAGAEQEKRRTKDPWEQTLANIPEIVETVWANPIEVVKIIHKIDDQERVASAALLTYVLRIAIGQQDTRHEMRLAGVMKTLGWERGPNKITIAGKQVRGYFRWRD